MMPRVLVALGVTALLGAACSNAEEQRNVVSEASALDSADQVAFGSRTVLTDAGLLRAEIFADTTLFLSQNTRVAMRGVHGVFFNAQGSRDATVTADRAAYDSKAQILEAYGNVVVTSVDGRVLKSPMLRFESAQNQILSDSAFTMTEPDGKEMRGVGFRADPNLQVVTVLRVERGRGGAVRLSP
ncbi:LPS export ABC transporter periplasmic protein LptC [Pseudogemmatithrix spongiicola]|uniref:LPS export ABC transporter periplasmic protein LptC n=1 Tax=Pseudogemmatithrix spongiicola TaxID=3062599 RepID=A0AA49K0C6_9BACT|nr:LPS export ABC transporter periplasmic protein LptC [Gemmatimonadaceae bacterium 'strain 138']WKW15092.1 LPS export ABC transporter periplasmic protein LptC [Gemmatimonadaceae bacterium 'strain 318']